MMRWQRQCWPDALSVTGLLLLLAGCGGGGSSLPPRIPSPAPVPTLTITTDTLPHGIVYQPYHQSLEATGGTPPYEWSLFGGSLPLGLGLETTGVISGTPDHVGVEAAEFSFTVQVRDSASARQAATRSLVIIINHLLEVYSQQLPPGNLEVHYEERLATHTHGGHPPLSFSLTSTSGPVPDGLTMADDGTLTGMPTQIGTFAFSAEVRDSAFPTQTATGDFTILIKNDVVVLNATLPFGIVGEPYNQAVEAVGGTRPYSWQVYPGWYVPPGLAFGSDGVLSGTPTEIYLAGFLIGVTDSSSPPQTTQAYIQVTIRPAFSFLTTSMPDGVLNQYYSEDIRVGGGRSPYTLEIVGGSLPPGLSLNPYWADAGYFGIMGTPTSLGLFPFTVRGAESSSPPVVLTQDLSIRINEPLVFITENLPPGLEGSPYSVTLEASGGVPPYTWEADSTCCPLPEQLTLDPATGQINGIPSSAFEGEVRLYLQDSSSPPQEIPRSFWMQIIGRLDILTTQLPTLQEGVPFDATLDFKGGTPPFSWAISAGGLPPGLSLDFSSLRLSGVPTTAGDYPFTLSVTDSGTAFPQSDAQELSVSVRTVVGRNDSLASATPLSNGTYRVSISPYADPIDSPQPDTDYYRLVAPAGTIVSITIFAERLAPASQLDSVIEIVNADGQRFTTCRDPGDIYLPFPIQIDSTPNEFDDPCINDDDRYNDTFDSSLELLVPGAAGETVALYVHVLDFRGDARPDFVYEVKISGAN